MPGKIVHVGLPRTGTMSLAHAMKKLGLVVARSNVCLYDWPQIDKADAVVDLAGSTGYQRLDRLYPGSAFILTTRRDRAAWLASCEKWWAKAHGPDMPAADRWGITHLFGRVDFNAMALLTSRERHEAEVRRYCAGRLFEIDLADADGYKWNVLAAAIKAAGWQEPLTPMEAWPHANRSS